MGKPFLDRLVQRWKSSGWRSVRKNHRKGGRDDFHNWGGGVCGLSEGGRDSKKRTLNLHSTIFYRMGLFYIFLDKGMGRERGERNVTLKGGERKV